METAYRRDGRVRPSGGKLLVVADGLEHVVLHSQTFGWGAYARPDLVQVNCGFATADEAVADLIGPPQGLS